MRSCVKPHFGTPTLYINGEPFPSLAYMTYYTECGKFADFSSHGYRLFSIPLFFGDGYINEITHLPPFKRGVFVTELPDFSELDADVERILATRPDAYIFPRVNVSLPRAWELSHPDECNDTGTSKFPDHRRASFSSDEWAKEVKRLITELVKHIEGSDYCEHIVGYQIAGGLTEEWMAFDCNGSQGLRSREGFAKLRKETGSAGGEEEYYKYLADVVVDRIDEFAAHVKRETGGRLAVGAFYGYTMELSSRTSCHHSLGRMLKSKNVDFLCSPVSYSCLRALGRDHPTMLPLDSLRLHGKLYFAENDTRTSLTRPPNGMPAYNSPIWLGPDEEGSESVMKLHFARPLTRGHAAWWFDMWGGWYSSPRYMRIAERAQEIYESTRAPYEGAELAVIVDENSVFKSSDDSAHKAVCYDYRETLGKIGTPYDLYLASDYESIKDKYKAIIALCPNRTELMSEIIKHAEAHNTPVITVTPENASELGSAALRDFSRTAGVHIYTEHDTAIYVGRGYLTVHTTESGEVNLALKEGTTLYEVFENKPYPASFYSDKGKTYIFKLVTQ